MTVLPRASTVVPITASGILMTQPTLIAQIRMNQDAPPIQTMQISSDSTYQLLKKGRRQSGTVTARATYLQSEQGAQLRGGDHGHGM